MRQTKASHGPEVSGPKASAAAAAETSAIGTPARKGRNGPVPSARPLTHRLNGLTNICAQHQTIAAAHGESGRAATAKLNVAARPARLA